MLDSAWREKEIDTERQRQRDRQETHRHTTERWRGSHELCPWFCCCRETGRAASQPSPERKGGVGELPGPLLQQQATGAPAGPLPHTPTHYGLHPWAWASLGTISGPFFLKY